METTHTFANGIDDIQTQSTVDMSQWAGDSRAIDSLDDLAVHELALLWRTLECLYVEQADADQPLHLVHLVGTAGTLTSADIVDVMNAVAIVGDAMEESTIDFDVDGDGEVAIQDVDAIVAVLLGEPVGRDVESRSDIDQDGEVTVTDILAWEAGVGG